jgi:O-antigen/teichoic acid export membrane protein
VQETIAIQPEAVPPAPPPTAGMTTKVVKGSLWNLAGQVAPLGVLLVTTPFVIRMLGTEAYGVLILVGLIPAYLGFADFGMSMASTKFASEAFGDGDLDREARIIRTAALIAFVGSLPFGIAIFLFSVPIVLLFNVPTNLISEASLALKFAAITFVVNILNVVFNTPELTRMRMDLNTLVTAGCRILGLVSIPIIIYFGGGVAAVVGALTVSAILTLIGHLTVSYRLLNKLFDTSFDRTIFPTLLRFGSSIAVSAIAAVLLVNSEKIVLARTTSIVELAHYSVAFTFANMATMFSGAMSQSLVPAFSRLLSPSRKLQLTDLYLRSSRFNVVALLPTLLILAIVAKPFFTIWAGEDFGMASIPPFYILLVGLFFYLSSFTAGSLLISSGRNTVIAKLFWVELIPYIVLTAALTIQYGAIGAAAAWSIRVAVEAFVLIALAKKTGGLPFDSMGDLRGLLAGAIVLTPPIILIAFGYGSSIWLILLTPISLLIYALIVWRTLIGQMERVWVRRKFGLA